MWQLSETITKIAKYNYINIVVSKNDMSYYPSSNEYEVIYYNGNIVDKRLNFIEIELNHFKEACFFYVKNIIKFNHE